MNNVFQDVTSKKIDIGYSPAGRSVLGKNCAQGLGYRWSPQAEGGTQDRGHSLFNTAPPRLVNNIFNFLDNRTKGGQKT